MAIGQLNIFAIFSDVCTKKSRGALVDDVCFESAMSNYMMCRILRMHDQFAKYARIANRYQTIWSKRDMYMFLFKNLPRSSKAPYNDFISKPKKTAAVNKV